MAAFVVLLLLVLNHVASASRYYYFSGKAYPLHYSPGLDLNVTGGNLLQKKSSTATNNIKRYPLHHKPPTGLYVTGGDLEEQAPTNDIAPEQSEESLPKTTKNDLPHSTTSRTSMGDNKVVVETTSPPLHKEPPAITSTPLDEAEPPVGRTFATMGDNKVVVETTSPPLHKEPPAITSTPLEKEEPPVGRTFATPLEKEGPLGMSSKDIIVDNGPPTDDKPSMNMDTQQPVQPALDEKPLVQTSTPPPSADKEPPPTRTSFLRNTSDGAPTTTGWRQRSQAFGANLKKLKTPKLNLKLPQQQAVENIKESSSKLMSTIAPAAIAIGEMFYRPNKTPITLPAVFALALLGSSCGFYLFLYFITVGYALGITLPLLAALVAHNTNSQLPNIPKLTYVHSGLVIAWGIRSLTFFLYREFVSWPELHEKVVQVNKAAQLNAKLFCWVTFSSFYVAMITPCLLRLETKKKWGVFGITCLCLQLCSLILESVADYQKNKFKSMEGNRNKWCNVGLWKISTHPNYLGEMLFWVGTYLGGMACFDSVIHWVAATVGLLFVMVVLRGAVSSLGAKHLRKYGNDVEFLEFRRTHSVLGPFHFTPQPKDRVSL